MPNKNLFIVCMNNAGSTLIHECISKCKNAVQLPRSKEKPFSATSSEGQVFADGLMPRPYEYGVGAVWTEKRSLFEKEKYYNWSAIKEKWKSGWMASEKWRESGVVLIEKSPPNVLRARMLEGQFDSPFFIVMVRDPYAVCEGMRRRWGRSIQRSARHWVEASKAQIKNIEGLNNSIWFRYEQLCNDPDSIRKKIVGFLPELNDLSFDIDISGTHAINKDNSKSIPISNLNKAQIDRLSARDIKIINKELVMNREVLKYFGYSII